MTEEEKPMTYHELAKSHGIPNKRAAVIAHVAAEAAASADGTFTATYAEICEATGTNSRLTVARAIQDAVAAGILAKPSFVKVLHVKGGQVYRLAEGAKAA